MDLQRRKFLQTSIATLGGAAGASISSSSAHALPETEKKPPKNPFSSDPVARVKLFGDVETSRIGMGTGMSGWNHSSQLTRMDRKKGESLIRHCYDSGLRFFDCADMYGTHEIISSTLQDKPRDSYTLSTKMWFQNNGDQPIDTVATVKKFLQELKTDYLDLFQLHCMMKPDWEDDYKRCMEDLEKCKEEGLIRGHGVSCHSFGALKNAAVNPWVDAVHVRLNSIGTRMEGSFEENVEVCQTAQDNGKGVICMKLVGEGTMKKLEERRESIDKVVRSQIIDVYIVGFEEEWQVDELITNIGDSLKAMEAEMKA
ncbi:MAG: aldo/keto reductase [Thermoguttaceae bacterium]|nr:aldo/keto reductase [Thermoguttaceae bacterium]